MQSMKWPQMLSNDTTKSSKVGLKRDLTQITQVIA